MSKIDTGGIGSRTKTGTVRDDTKALALRKKENLMLDVLRKGDMEASEGQLSRLDFCEQTVRKMTGIRRVSALAIALIITHIRDQRLFPEELTWEKYRAQADKRLGMDRRNVWRYEMTGDAFMLYHADLQEIGFSEHGDVSKLIYLIATVHNHGKRKALKMFGELSTNEYAAWAKGKVAKIPYKSTEFGVTKDALLYNGREVITFGEVQDIVEKGKIDEFRKMVSGLRRKK